MNIYESCLIVIGVLCAGYGLYAIAAILLTVRSVPLMESIGARGGGRKWPRVSVIVAACDEEESIEAAVKSRLREDYPNAQYILVDDRSTDRTGEIIDRLAAEDPRVRAIHVRELPEGWLGKVHAMHLALEEVDGDWILFSDADVHHQTDALRRVIAHCEERGIDHMALFPSVWSRTFWLDVAMNAFLRAFTVIARAWKVPDPKSKVAIGGGNFNLVRRSAFERAFPHGLEPLRLEVLDDAALGQMLKWSGARPGMLNARGFVGLYFYRSVWDAVCGMEKNAFAAISRYSIPRFVAAITLMMTLELGSFGVAALAPAGGWIRYLAFATIAVCTLREIITARWLARPILPALLAPLGLLVMYFGAIRSMVLTVANNGIRWRGTHYPLDALRRGRRFLLV